MDDATIPASPTTPQRHPALNASATSQRAADAAAHHAADRARHWAWEDGGWGSLVGDTGGRLATLGFHLAAQATAATTDATPLSLEDLVPDSDGEFTSSSIEQLRSAAIGAELNPTSELMERLVLAMEIAFDSGLRHAAASNVPES